MYKLQCNNSYRGILQNVVVVLVLVIFDWSLFHIPPLNWEQGLGRKWSFLQGIEQEAGKEWTDRRGGTELFYMF